jgi:signal transduction histidine kinase
MGKQRNKKTIMNYEIIVTAEELLRMHEKLSDLLKFKDLMTTFLAHDLKNALNTLVNADVRVDPMHQLSEIRNAGRRMMNVVNNILGIIGFENGSIVMNATLISHNEMVMNAFRRLRMQAAAQNITFSFNHDRNYTLLADGDIAERILVNLLDNAIRHAPAGSSIEVTAELLDGFIKITVKDRGDGIAPDMLPFIFEKYTHGDHPDQDASRRYGLGLAFCKLAVEKHGGTTGVISEQGKGSEIWFTLPMASVNVIQPADQIKPAVICDFQELPEFTEAELSWLREHYGPLLHISIHQISDIKDLLEMPDSGASQAICRWKNAVIAATNQYNVSSFSHLVELIPDNDG